MSHVTMAARAYRRGLAHLAIVYSMGAMLLLIAILFALCAGRFQIPADRALRIVANLIVPGQQSWTDLEARIVLLVRAPRALLAALAGAGLALSGAALQGIFRNPLVSPQILGVSSGAAFGGAIAILFGLSGVFLIGSAFLMGLVAIVLVGAIARVDGHSDTVVVVLSGIVVGALFSALVSLIQFLADPNSSLPSIVFWLMGSFSSTTWPRLWLAVPILATAAAVLSLMSFRINVLSLGDEDARALGLPVERDRWLVFVLVALIVGATVSVAGIIGWVGLVVPHAARLVVGADHRILMPVSALLGSAYLLFIDTLARSATAAEIPLGVLTALVGAPVFALLLRRARREEIAA
jgi:iron complex transport system permease protein